MPDDNEELTPDVPSNDDADEDESVVTDSKLKDEVTEDD